MKLGSDWYIACICMYKHLVEQIIYRITTRGCSGVHPGNIDACSDPSCVSARTCGPPKVGHLTPIKILFLCLPSLPALGHLVAFLWLPSLLGLWHLVAFELPGNLHTHSGPCPISRALDQGQGWNHKVWVGAVRILTLLQGFNDQSFGWQIHFILNLRSLLFLFLCLSGLRCLLQRLICLGSTFDACLLLFHLLCLLGLRPLRFLCRLDLALLFTILILSLLFAGSLSLRSVVLSVVPVSAPSSSHSSFTSHSFSHRSSWAVSSSMQGGRPCFQEEPIRFSLFIWRLFTGEVFLGSGKGVSCWELEPWRSSGCAAGAYSTVGGVGGSSCWHSSLEILGGFGSSFLSAFPFLVFFTLPVLRPSIFSLAVRPVVFLAFFASFSAFFFSSFSAFFLSFSSCFFFAFSALAVSLAVFLSCFSFNFVSFSVCLLTLSSFFFSVLSFFILNCLLRVTTSWSGISADVAPVIATCAEYAG